MIQISKTEAAALRKAFPQVSIKRTTNKYYVEDNMAVRNALRKLKPKAVVSL